MKIHALVFKIWIFKKILVQNFEPEIFNVWRSFEPRGLQYSAIAHLKEEILRIQNM